MLTLFIARVARVASNIFDEEPGEDEIEYSDDDEEAEARKKLKASKGQNKRRQADVVENAESQCMPLAAIPLFLALCMLSLS